MKQCKYCKENIANEAKKCKVCGEPFYFWGKVIKFTPVMSIFLAAASIWFAMIQYEYKIVAVNHAKEVVEESRIQEEVAVRTIKEMQSSNARTEELKRRYDINRETTLYELEQKLEENPDNLRTRQEILIFKSLENDKARERRLRSR